MSASPGRWSGWCGRSPSMPAPAASTCRVGGGTDILVGRASPAARDAVEQVAAEAVAALAAGRALRGAVPRRALPVLAIGRVADAYLKTLRRAGYDPFAPALQIPDPLAAARLWWGARIGGY